MISKILLNNVSYPINSEIISIGNPFRNEGRELKEFTWENIIDKIRVEDFSDLRIGDYKTINLQDSLSTSFKMRLADINYEPAFSTLSRNFVADFISDETFPTSISWGGTSNNGTSTQKYPYLNSNVPNFLKENVYNKLPEDLKSLIISKYSKVSERYSSGGILTNDSGASGCFIGNIWIPSVEEIFGMSTIGSDFGKRQFLLYKMMPEKRLRGIGYLTRTLPLNNSNQILGISKYGVCMRIDLNKEVAVPVCFSLAKK